MAFVALDKTIHRLVESQEQVASNQIVNDLEEQALLEQMLERAKPPAVYAELSLHYLLYTPFRYPPLPHGSRFGSRLEPSLFYASLQPATVFAESAYYRFLFWSGMAEPPPGGKLNTQHLLFSIGVKTQRGLQLQCEPFVRYSAYLTAKAHYTATQTLGGNLRRHGVEAFEYQSARDTAGGINMALFTPEVFAEQAPTAKQHWLCETRADQVAYYHNNPARVLSFPLEQFLVEGRLPLPAA